MFWTHIIRLGMPHGTISAGAEIARQRHRSTKCQTLILEAPALVEGALSRRTASPKRRDVRILIPIYLGLRGPPKRKIALQNIDISIELEE